MNSTNNPKLDFLKYFISPKVLPLPVGLWMIFTGLATKVETSIISFEIKPLQGTALAIIGLALVGYSLWLSRKFMSVESVFVENLVAKEKCEAEALRVLKTRNSLTEHQDQIMKVIERLHPDCTTREYLETHLPEDIEGRELSVRLGNLELQGLITSKEYGESYMYKLHLDYSTHIQ